MTIHLPSEVSAAPDALLGQSVRVLLQGQAPSGAFIACPSFPTYRYAWLRDGSFCALALDAAGEREAAAAFHGWVARTIARMASRLDAVLARAAQGESPDPRLLLPTRYTLEGQEEDSAESWPNFQLDGYGTWLFALESHLAGTPCPREVEAAVHLTARYLSALWREPCFDYWEEYGDRQHASTLVSVTAGLAAAARLTGEPGWAEEAACVREHLLATCVVGGRLRKGPRDDRVDASLLSASVPFGVLDPTDPIMSATVDAIRADLTAPSGGIRRYLGDTYYGGGSWVLLTAWLGWFLRVSGDLQGADAVQAWVHAHVSDAGTLPEQIVEDAQDPSFVPVWVARWGQVADPLLWSHAQYVLLATAVPSIPG